MLIPEKFGLALAVGAYTVNSSSLMTIAIVFLLSGIALNRRLDSRLVVLGEILSECIIGLLAHLLIVFTMRGWLITDMAVIQTVVVLVSLALGIALRYYFSQISDEGESHES